MKTQKIKQVLLGLMVPAVIVAAWVCATHFGSIPTSILPRISTQDIYMSFSRTN